MPELRSLLLKATGLSLLAGFGGLFLGLAIGLAAWGLNRLWPGSFAAGSPSSVALRWLYTLLEPVVYLGLVASLGCSLLLIGAILFRLGRR